MFHHRLAFFLLLGVSSANISAFAFSTLFPTSDSVGTFHNECETNVISLLMENPTHRKSSTTPSLSPSLLSRLPRSTSPLSQLGRRSAGGKTTGIAKMTTATSTALHMSNFLDDIGNFFDSLSGGSGDSNKNRSNNGSDQSGTNEKSIQRDGDMDKNLDMEGSYTGSTRIITIPAKTMKTGGLRLYCSLYLMGLQNTPNPNSWKAHQSDNYEVNLRYHDLSGSIIIQFCEQQQQQQPQSSTGDEEIPAAVITVDRLGSSPSTSYLMHESIILNGFLDELHAIVYEGGDIKEEDRLLTLFHPGDAIEKAREVVSFA